MNNTNKLTGVVIDAGHGGLDSGAVGENAYEKDYNLLISQYMYNRLKELPQSLLEKGNFSFEEVEDSYKELCKL